MTRTTHILIMLCVCVVAKAQTDQQVTLQITGSQTYAAKTVAPLKSALLMLDTISFGGKSGFVTLHKGQTTMYLVLSNLDVPCEMKDVYDRKAFLRANGPRLLPNLPDTVKDEDFIVIGVYQQHYDPRKVSGPPLADLISGSWHIADFYHVIPGSGWRPKPKDVEQIGSVLPSIVHFSDLVFGLQRVGAREKDYQLTGKSDAGAWVYTRAADKTELYLDPRRHEVPFENSMLDLIREGDGWTATFDLNAKNFKLSGRVPLRICQPNFISVK